MREFVRAKHIIGWRCLWVPLDIQTAFTLGLCRSERHPKSDKITIKDFNFVKLEVLSN